MVGGNPGAGGFTEFQGEKFKTGSIQFCKAFEKLNTIGQYL